jgi:hypothetical protein
VGFSVDEVALVQVSSCQHGFIPSPPMLSNRGDQPYEHFRVKIRQHLCIKVKLKESHYRPGQVLRVPGGSSFQISR